MSEFTHSTDVSVRFRDTDAMGHVNNAVYLTYLEVARQDYWRLVSGSVDYAQVPFVVAHATLDFRTPATAGEVLRVRMRTAWLGRSSFGQEYEVRERDSERLVVEASVVLVTYDYRLHRAMPVPDWLRAGLESAEGRPLPPRSAA